MNKLACPRKLTSSIISSLGSSTSLLFNCPRSTLLPRLAHPENVVISSKHHNHQHYSSVISTQKPKPLIVCGRHANIARAGRAGMRPQYDYMHVITSLEQGLHDLPFLRDGKTPPPFFIPIEDGGLHKSNSLSSPREDAKVVEQVGSQDYSEPAIAVIVGGGFDDEAFEKMREVVDGGGKGKWEVPWLRVDSRKTIGRPSLGKDYGMQVVSRAKEELGRWEKEGLLGKEGVCWI